MSNGLDQDQARHYVGPDLGLNCLQRLHVSADEGFRRWQPKNSERFSMYYRVMALPF